MTNHITTMPIEPIPADQPASEAEAAPLSLIDLFPPRSPEEEEAFDASVKATGRILQPIDVDEDGNVLDGVRRKRAALKHGIPCPTHLVAGLTDEEKREYRVEVNINRRHLSTGDRKVILEKLLREDPNRNNTWLGELTRLDPKTVATVRASMETKSEIPTLTEFRTRKGTYPRLTRIAATTTQDLRKVQEKARELRPENMPGRPVSRRALGKHVRQQRRHDLSGHPVPDLTDDEFRLEVCDFRELDVDAGSLNLIFCDIPYSRDFAPHWEPLAEFAASGLKSGGHLLLMTGQDCLPDIMAAFGKHLNWVWPLALIYPGNNRAMVHHKKVRTGWKPILWFSRGKYEPRDEVIDTFNCTSPEKEYGDWQQGVEECEHFLGLLTSPGDLVCDPCLGHGTTAVATKRLGGRRFLGCDIRQDRVDDTKRRLALETLEEGEMPSQGG